MGNSKVVGGEAVSIGMCAQEQLTAHVLHIQIGMVIHLEVRWIRGHTTFFYDWMILLKQL